LQHSLADHRASHELYLDTTQARIDTFAQISRLVEECRGLKLPLEPQGTLPVEEEKMEVDEPSPASASPGSSPISKLSAVALPFAPTAAPEKARASTPPATITTMKPPPTGHGLPSKPSRPSTPTTPAAPRGASATRVVSSSLPSRPSALRSVTGPAATGSLEEGELGGEEEGEVSEERGLKRTAGAGDREGRVTRSRQ